MAGEIKSQFFADVKINGEPLGKELVDAFEWKSFINGGYEIRATVSDPGHRILNDLKIWGDDSSGTALASAPRGGYLRKARKDPLVIEFKLGYPGGEKFETKNGQYQKAILSDLTIYGDPGIAGIEFVAIDPPSWYLNAGKGDGKVFTGSVSTVINDVVTEFSGGTIKAKVSKTKDDPHGKWGMMRQDPKTFILSLLDWSSSVLNNAQSSWIIGVNDDTIFIQDQIDFLQRKKHLADFNASTSASLRNDIVEYSTLNNTLLTAYQTKLITQGISAVSGKYLDKQTEKKTEIDDENTGNKLNARVDKSMAFDKPHHDYSTSIVATPEFSGGELGLAYEDWIGGRPQQLYLQMLPMIMRCRFTVRGNYDFYDNENLGVSTIKITWKDIGTYGLLRDYFLHGHWIVYGFHHRMMRGDDPHWWTDVYAYRIDQDATAKNIP